MSSLKNHLEDSLEAIDAQGLYPNFDEWLDDEVNDLLGELLSRVEMDNDSSAKDNFMDSFFDVSSDWSISDLMRNPNLVNEAMIKTLKTDADVCCIVADWLAENSLRKGAA